MILLAIVISLHGLAFVRYTVHGKRPQQLRIIGYRLDSNGSEIAPSPSRRVVPCRAATAAASADEGSEYVELAGGRTEKNEACSQR